MFIINTDKINLNHDKFFICDDSVSKRLIKNGFPLLSAIYRENKYVFVKTDRLVSFLEGGEKI